MKNYSLIIWDFNGTLIDDVWAALASVNDMLAQRGKDPITLEEYREYIDVPIRRFYERVLELEHEDYNSVLEQFQSGYERHLGDCGLTAFAVDVLRAASAKGIPQVVLSSSEQSQIERLLDKYNISQYFDAVLGSDNLLAGSKVERAQDYIGEHNIDCANTLVIGDLLHDFEVARAIGAGCLLLTSGHHDRARLLLSGVRVEDSLKVLINEK